MRRRYFIKTMLATTALALCGGAAIAIDADDPVEFVRALYAREVARQAAGTSIGEAEFLEVFTRETRQIWLAGRGSTVNIPAGPILNVFFGWGVLPGHAVALQDVSAVRSPRVLTVVVALTIRGEPHQVSVLPVKQDGRWRVSNIAYDRGEDFVAFRRRLSGH
jgi:hypothetical protein